MEGDSPDTRDSVSAQEQKQEDLIQRVLQSGRSSISTWTRRATPSGYAGYQGVVEEDDPNKENRYNNLDTLLLAFKFPKLDPYYLEQEMSQLVKKGIYEIAVVAPLTADVVETRTRQVPYKRFFRTKYKPEQEQVVAGKRNLTMKEVAGKGEEPAVAIYYYASSRSNGISPELWYKDAGGRPGNFLNAKIIIPLELAEEISAEIKNSPTILRRLVEAFVRAKYPDFFVEETWDRHGRPPYERWDSSETGSRLYFVDLIKEPEAEHLPINEATLARTITISPPHSKS